MIESGYRTKLVKKIMNILPEAVILKNDPRYIQGLPDLIILYKTTWAALEIKRSSKASVRPNQEHYIKKLGAMSFASFINPENEGEVLDALQAAFGIRGKTRVSQS